MRIDIERLRNEHGMLALIGKTPLVRLNRVADERGAVVWAKCEQYNPGGSVKDRPALHMIETAEKAGRIAPGRSTIVEPTSGNTGIGLALVCTAKGYPLILTMPESMSLERRALLKSYGARIELTPEADAMDGAVARAHELAAENADFFMPDQFRNPANPGAHEVGTGPEILEQMAEDSIDAFVAGIGTGGTITGIGRCLRKARPSCQIIGVEPESSPVLSGGVRGPHKIQGIGAGFVPEILDRSLLNEIRTVADDDAYRMSKRLARDEGLLVGISAGANVHIACQVARGLPSHAHVVTVLCDTGERYFSLDEYFR